MNTIKVGRGDRDACKVDQHPAGEGTRESPCVARAARERERETRDGAADEP